MPIKFFRKKEKSALVQDVAKALAQAAVQALQQIQHCSRANRATFWLGFWTAARSLLQFIPVRRQEVEQGFDDEMEKLL